MAFCSNCGTELKEEANFCPACGKAVQKEAEAAKTAQEQNNSTTQPETPTIVESKNS